MYPQQYQNQEEHNLPCAQDEVEVRVTLPVLPLKGAAAFPWSTISFEVGRPKSIQAIEQAISRDSYLFLVAQKDAEIEEPGEDDFYTVGTVCGIKQVIRQAADRLKLVVAGEYRAQICRLFVDDLLYQAELQPIEEDYSIIQPNASTYKTPLDVAADVLYCDAYRRRLNQEMDDYCKLLPQDNSARLALLQSIENITHYSYELANFLPIPLGKKQQLLETGETKARLELLSSFLHYEIEVLRLATDLSMQVTRSFNKQQKEAYLREQLAVIRKELGEDGDSELEAFRQKLQAGRYPEAVSSRVEKELRRLETMPSGMAEGQVLRSYVELVLELPWNKTGQENTDIRRAAAVLEENHYGMEKVKERILDFLVVRKRQSVPQSNILCLYGPPGVGKTSIARSMAEALGREYIRVSLGGVHDEAEIRGHRKTYVGAMPGRIIQAMKQAGTANPLLLLDEIDKLSDDQRGDPASALLEVLDSAQNQSFRDHYLELPFDLSRVFFLTTANRLDTIPPALRDRLEIIELSSYTAEEKFEIARRHLLPKLRNTYALTEREWDVSDAAIKSLIQDYTAEAGVRTLERLLTDVLRKSLRRLEESGQPSCLVEEDDLERYLGPARRRASLSRYRSHPEDAGTVGVAMGLAWTAVGGVTLAVEVNVMPGCGVLELTGQLGGVMRESAKAAISYLRSVCGAFGVDPDFYRTRDIHIHLPEGATPKDGPSAGVTLATAVLSALTGRPVRMDAAMTGEITIRGMVLPVGGIQEKVLAAVREGMRTVVLPEENRCDVESLPDGIRDRIQIVYARRLEDVLAACLTE